ncbi:hypothetical protein [Gordonia otitidis]|uniref:Uncharacterized protein n=1 Tax=Gordonia otitidis (strain DSM 44809 / CCUG 52243 / JCM 12355 / NBRC 100426 / IFM 10032) TaxID=1108044 RepID=H5TS26_GORO1|nr:hypothetical protein [Gordonia otitidis]GAB36284.1 hypothetical protein GOOTI_206_00170 [Gordonia otitidis NBRC 100426]
MNHQFPHRKQVQVGDQLIFMDVYRHSILCYSTRPEAFRQGLDGGYVGIITWPDGQEYHIGNIEIMNASYRGIGLGLEMLKAAVDAGATPDMLDRGALTCSGAYLINRFISECSLGLDPVLPTPRNEHWECRRGSECDFYDKVKDHPKDAR